MLTCYDEEQGCCKLRDRRLLGGCLQRVHDSDSHRSNTKLLKYQCKPRYALHHRDTPFNFALVI